MSAVFKCDCCEQYLTEDDSRIALDVVGPMTPVEPNEDGVIELRPINFFAQGQHHFCSMACLSSWAMGRALEATEVES